MEDILEPAEILRRYAVLLERVSSLPYSVAVTIRVDTSDPSQIDAQDGKPLAQCDLVVGDNDSWDGDILATVRASDLQVEEDHIWSLSEWFRGCGQPYVDLLGEALLTSHLSDFERFSTHVAPAAWERGCLSATHRHYGLTLLADEGDQVAGLRFQFHASAIGAAVNQRLMRAAEQGDVE